MTFGLVYTVYATAIDPKKGSLGTIAPICIGLIVGAKHIGPQGFRLRLDEPDEGIRAGAGKLEVGEPLDILGRATPRRRPGWRCLRIGIGDLN